MFLENLVMDTSAINVTLGQYEFRKDKYKPPWNLFYSQNEDKMVAVSWLLFCFRDQIK